VDCSRHLARDLAYRIDFIAAIVDTNQSTSFRKKKKKLKLLSIVVRKTEEVVDDLGMQASNNSTADCNRARHTNHSPSPQKSHTR
jgi:hypothetical protein